MATKSSFQMLIFIGVLIMAMTDVLPAPGRKSSIAARDHRKGHHHKDHRLKPTESVDPVSITETLTEPPIVGSV